jgi:hypothetical protein
MTDQPISTPKLSVAVHFLGIEKPAIYHCDEAWADNNFVILSSGMIDMMVPGTTININKDIVERYVTMPYDPELTPTEEPESDANAEKETTGLELDLRPAPLPPEADEGYIGQ